MLINFGVAFKIIGILINDSIVHNPLKANLFNLTFTLMLKFSHRSLYYWVRVIVKLVVELIIIITKYSIQIFLTYYLVFNFKIYQANYYYLVGFYSGC